MSADIRLVRWPDQDRDDFERLTLALARVRDAVRRSGSDLVSPDVPQGPAEPSDLDRARALLAQNRALTTIGDHAELFVNPAWAMMLTLFVDEGEGRSTDIAAAQAASGVLPPPAARWLALLEARGLAALSDGADGSHVALTELGRTFLCRCLRAL